MAIILGIPEVYNRFVEFKRNTRFEYRDWIFQPTNETFLGS
jgi:hypothetical protein